MLQAPGGATIDDIVAVTSRRVHTVRGAMSRALKKRLRLEVMSDKIKNCGRVYKLRAAWCAG